MTDWRLTPQNCALVVVDVQEKLMNVMPRRAELIAGVQKLLGTARVLKIPIVITAQYVKGLGATVSAIRHTLEECGAYEPLEKSCFSSFGSGEFPFELPELKLVG